MIGHNNRLPNDTELQLFEMSNINYNVAVHHKYLIISIRRYCNNL